MFWLKGVMYGKNFTGVKITVDGTEIENPVKVASVFSICLSSVTSSDPALM